MKKKCLIGFVIFSILLINANLSKNESMALENRGENLIRFHVLANSDSPEDQQLKLKVRDQVIEYVSTKLEVSESVDETREVLKSNLENIEKVAIAALKENESTYGVKVYLEDHVFPTKRYGDVVFPAGNYEALRVVIEEGTGQNWWCVMFPPLCFVDVKHGLTDEKTKEYLKEALTEEEYEIIYRNTDHEQLPLQLRSKVFEFFQNTVGGWRLFAWL
ncbi:stage II sporulation protein R [Serpentinicella sp. ANB-PHB4]|uniref:stage II sporulation protein R n=1 Tax=Serpentinicella sp. ANB-PHB4 TaxID=3074076 RepID=UPI0028636040|nr:stage II sporulation protein R [Serpentinicella sp. ANB-PHB4]MDR5659130.1 stage II sporulation protein R [Serpentinicella sp. ANB-PHB4]